MATSDERLEQLERSLQQAGNARPAGNELQNLVFGNCGYDNLFYLDGGHACARKAPPNFAGDEESWKSWSFVMLSFSAAVSPELRTLMEKARTTVTDVQNVNLTAAE